MVPISERCHVILKPHLYLTEDDNMLQFSLSLNLYSFLYHSTVAIFSELYKLVLIMLSLDKDNQHKRKLLGHFGFTKVSTNQQQSTTRICWTRKPELMQIPSSPTWDSEMLEMQPTQWINSCKPGDAIPMYFVPFPTTVVTWKKHRSCLQQLWNGFCFSYSSRHSSKLGFRTGWCFRILNPFQQTETGQQLNCIVVT